MKQLIKTKRAATFSGITEIIIIGVLFILMFALVVGGMNAKYNKNYDSDFNLGLFNLANDTQNDFKELQQSFQDATSEGQASFFTTAGLVVSTSYEMILTVINLLWSFINGSWISKSVYLMNLPQELGTILQLLYYLAIGFILLRLLFKPTGRV